MKNINLVIKGATFQNSPIKKNILIKLGTIDSDNFRFDYDNAAGGWDMDINAQTAKYAATMLLEAGFGRLLSSDSINIHGLYLRDSEPIVDASYEVVNVNG